MKTYATMERTRRRDCSPSETATPTEATMAGILLWLMGVPLIVIILLYLIF
jgi:heme O synthase-like polyprenyltransferase